MRQYQPIWEQIKKYKTATLIVHASNHLLVSNAVHAERFKDAGYKLLLSEAEVKMKLVVISDKKKGTITFNLVDNSDIRMEDL